MHGLWRHFYLPFRVMQYVCCLFARTLIIWLYYNSIFFMLVRSRIKVSDLCVLSGSASTIWAMLYVHILYKWFFLALSCLLDSLKYFLIIDTSTGSIWTDDNSSKKVCPLFLGLFFSAQMNLHNNHMPTYRPWASFVSEIKWTFK